MIRKRPTYRKWTDPDGDYNENYLMIHPSGIMIQISFDNEGLGKKCLIYQTSPSNPLSPEVFRKYKDVCLKGEFDSAQRKAISLLKGQLMFLSVKK